MADEALPIALVDSQSLVRDLHVASRVMERAARRRAQEVDQRLLFAEQAILASVLPKPGELRIGLQPNQQIIGNCSNRVVSAEAGVRARSGIFPPLTE